MGSADVVPGVSGGTMALILGIYERLLSAINNINFMSIKKLFDKNFYVEWKKLDGYFMVVLFMGILTGIFLISGIINDLMKINKIFIWSFFFGLILSSTFLIKKLIKEWNLFAFSIGLFFAIIISLLSPSEGSENLLYIFFCGVIASIAMILPGISGAFILILLGVYSNAIESVEKLRLLEPSSLKILSSLGLGAIVGIKIFSKIITKMFKKRTNTILSLIVGFLLGSLYKVWPWQEKINYNLENSNMNYEFFKPYLPNVGDLNSDFYLAIIVFLFGCSTVLIINKINPEVIEVKKRK